MNTIRRTLLQGATGAGVLSVAAAAGLLKPTRALAGWNKQAFAATKKDEALSAIGAGDAENSELISVRSPDIAENGAVVPVEVMTSLSGVESIAIVSEKNINPLIAVYRLTNTEGYLNTRIKMGMTGKIRAIVKAGGKTYTTAKEVKVTVGGCGG